jgi:predicted Fe-S protein YdhL (DUF1289 family)
MIQGKVKEQEAKFEEVFAYGKTRAVRGAARFTTEEAMWSYMTQNAGKHVHEFLGRRIFANADGRKKLEDRTREKAVRKVVRAIIEYSGGNGSEVKAALETNYKKGIVWWKGVRAAEWDAAESKMVLLGDAVPLQAAFDVLMG